MAGGVQADAHVVLGLEVGQGRALSHRVGHRGRRSSTLISRCIIICWSPSNWLKNGIT